MESPEKSVSNLFNKPRILSCSEHGISHTDISENALEVLCRLKNANYRACLVGGGVRDLLLGTVPQDFDIATDAHPEQVRKLFANSRLIGRRFRLAHVYFDRDIVEVSTFRATHHTADRPDQNGRILRDNCYGNLEDDAWRRDFTVNALYYDIRDFSIIDHVGGIEDIYKKRLRIIGDPTTRYREDPVRMLRAFRLAKKLGFTIHPASLEPISELATLLQDVPPARLYNEFTKLCKTGYSKVVFSSLIENGLFEYLFLQTANVLKKDTDDSTLNFIENSFSNTDRRLAQEKPVNPTFLVAALLWVPVQRLTQKYIRLGFSEIEAVQLAGDTVISDQIKQTVMPRYKAKTALDIWILQSHLTDQKHKNALQLLKHQRFRIAYDFLLLRAQCGEDVHSLASWWTKFQRQYASVIPTPFHARQQRRPRYLRQR